jgi:hypothetical protein
MSFIETNEPMPGFNEQPLEYQNTQLATYVPPNTPANAYNNQLPLPQPYINTYFQIEIPSSASQVDGCLVLGF